MASDYRRKAEKIHVECLRADSMFGDSHVGCSVWVDDRFHSFVDFTANTPLDVAERQCREMTERSFVIVGRLPADHPIYALAARRRAARLRLTDIREVTGCSVSKVSDWERGITEPTPEQLAAYEACVVQRESSAS